MSKVYLGVGGLSWVENLLSRVYLDPWGRCTWWL